MKFPENRIILTTLFQGDLPIGPSGTAPLACRVFGHKLRLEHDGRGIGSPSSCIRRQCDYYEDGVTWPDDSIGSDAPAVQCVFRCNQCLRQFIREFSFKTRIATHVVPALSATPAYAAAHIELSGGARQFILCQNCSSKVSLLSRHPTEDFGSHLCRGKTLRPYSRILCSLCPPESDGDAPPEIVPCPFCDRVDAKAYGPANSDSSPTGEVWHVECHGDCCAIGPSAATREEAIGKWNQAATRH